MNIVSEWLAEPLMDVAPSASLLCNSKHYQKVYHAVNF